MSAVWYERLGSGVPLTGRGVRGVRGARGERVWSVRSFNLAVEELRSAP